VLYKFIRTDRPIVEGNEVAVISETSEHIEGRDFTRLVLSKEFYRLSSLGNRTPPRLIPGDQPTLREAVLAAWRSELADSNFIPYDPSLHGPIDEKWLEEAALRW